MSKCVTYQNSVFLDIGHQIYDRASNNDLYVYRQKMERNENNAIIYLEVNLLRKYNI